jgi:uncharacterized DUF497 family protein
LRYTFEWDPVKAKENLRKHGVSFQRAAELILDPLAVSVVDPEHSETEERWVTTGRDTHGRILVLVHTFSETSAEECKIRVISARKATKGEAHAIQGKGTMKKEYDFSKGERGKFYRPDAELNIPIYLDPDVATVVREQAKRKDASIERVVNDWLRKDIRSRSQARRVKAR